MYLAQPIFAQNKLYITFTAEKGQFLLATSVIFKKPVLSKQSAKRRNFAQSGHPARFPYLSSRHAWKQTLLTSNPSGYSDIPMCGCAYTIEHLYIWLLSPSLSLFLSPFLHIV
jgi:hypothetical protein